jgi:signal transduction histidine kinase
MTIPFWNRLSTRLSLLIVLIVLILAVATAVLLARGFSSTQNEIFKLLVDSGIKPTTDISNLLRSTIINLIAVFLLTLVAATVFSRSFLVEPINSLAIATQEIAAGNLQVQLPITTKNELGLLAGSFNDMSQKLLLRTDELLKANEALRQSEARLEHRVQERTAELVALLELSNSIALTIDDRPLLEHIFDYLYNLVPFQSIGLFERLSHTLFQIVLERGDIDTDQRQFVAISESKQPLHQNSHHYFPLIVRDKVVGILVMQSSSLDQEKLPIISAFANQAGVAIANTQLYKQVQEKAAFDERQHLARELHDSVSQALYSIVLGTHAARKQLQHPERAESALEYVQNLAEAGLAEMRALIFELRPEVLEKEGLAAAMRKQVEALEVRHKLKADFDTDGEPNLPFGHKQTLYRITQEALHNIVKHAKATYVNVSLKEFDQHVQVCIQDKGIGFNVNENFSERLGLKSMRERTEALGGRFELASTLGQGTTIMITIPRGEL